MDPIPLRKRTAPSNDAATHSPRAMAKPTTTPTDRNPAEADLPGPRQSATAEPSTSSPTTSSPTIGRIRRVYHLHLPLVLFCGVSLLIAIGAFNSNNNLLFWLFSLALAMLIVSGIVSGQMLMGVRIERERTEPAEAGSPLIVRYRLTNTNRFVPVFALAIVEEPQASSAQPLASLAVAKAAKPTLRGPESFCTYLPARTTLIIEGQSPTFSRGEVLLSHLRIISEFPFGIVRKSLLFTQPTSVIVHPARVAEITIDAPSNRGAPSQQVSRERLSRVGSGDEFHSLREYGPGDSPRMVAWRASARREATTGTIEPLVRQTAATPTQRLVIVLDLAPAATDAEYELAISQTATLLSAPAGLTGLASIRSAIVGLWIPRTGLYEPPSGHAAASPSRSGKPSAKLRDLLTALTRLPRFEVSASPDRHEPPPHSMPAFSRDIGLIVVTGHHAPQRLSAADFQPHPSSATPRPSPRTSRDAL